MKRIGTLIIVAIIAGGIAFMLGSVYGKKAAKKKQTTESDDVDSNENGGE